MLLHLHPDVVSTDTDDGTVLLHLTTGRYWQLNSTGAGVLRRLLDGCTPDDIAAELADRHAIPPERAEHDVQSIVSQLSSSGLVVTS
ncbi:lasso peptide biosynthesis PqqD family chaperone [Streptomyces sp. NPDC048045]|uniref:lasso peptide biosynthesis PqqD family chaperone n=1 Tax=Streptomyces sp. NPDC048045 TaxID=3154710 RepID=UPI00341CF1AD